MKSDPDRTRSSRYRERPIELFEYPDPDDEPPHMIGRMYCPHCREIISENLCFCDYCARSVDGHPIWSQYPWWFIAIGLLGMATVALQSMVN